MLVERLEHVQELLDRVGSGVLGDRLRRVRLQQKRSIREVASAAGLSKTSIVRLERGESVRPATILQVCEALSMHVERLATLSTDELRPAVVHHRADDRWVDMADAASGPLLGLDRPLSAGERARAAAAGIRVPVCLIQSRLSGGSMLPSVLEIHERSVERSHPGEEFVYVLEGRARIDVGKETFELEEGEAVTFWSAEPHRYAPADPAAGPVRLLSVRIDG